MFIPKPAFLALFHSITQAAGMDDANKMWEKSLCHPEKFFKSTEEPARQSDISTDVARLSKN